MFTYVLNASSYIFLASLFWSVLLWYKPFMSGWSATVSVDLLTAEDRSCTVQTRQHEPKRMKHDEPWPLKPFTNSLNMLLRFLLLFGCIWSLITTHKNIHGKTREKVLPNSNRLQLKKNTRFHIFNSTKADENTCIRRFIWKKDITKISALVSYWWWNGLRHTI